MVLHRSPVTILGCRSASSAAICAPVKVATQGGEHAGRRRLSSAEIRLWVRAFDHDIGVDKSAEFLEFGIVEGGLQQAAPTEQHDFADLAVAESIQSVFGDGGEIDFQFGLIRMTVLPRDEFSSGEAAG